MPELLDILFFRAGHTAAVVSIGCSLLGVAAGVIGAFAVLRKRSLMGDALAHATLPGIALAFITATALAGVGITPKSLPVLLIGAAAGGVLGVLCVHALVRASAGRIREDAAIGVVLSVFFGVGYVLLSYIQRLPTGTQAGLKTFIFGQPAAMSVRDAYLIGSVAIAAVLAAAALYKEFRLLCFDDEFARAQGWPAGLLDLALMTLVVIVTVVGLQAVGLLLVVAMLTIPPAAARFWTDRLGTLLFVSAAVGAGSGYLGVSVSALAPGLPAGAIIVLVGAGLFTLSAAFAPNRGLLAAAVRRVRLARRIELDHALRAVYEALELSGFDPARPPPRLALSQAQGALGASATARLRGLRSRGLAIIDNGALLLTPAGFEAASRAVRNHRLWEQYLVANADLAPSHVDRAADMIEHVLGPDLIHELEAALAAEGRAVPPASVHPLARIHRLPHTA